MKYENLMDPTEAQFAELLGGEGEGPLYMVNLLKFKEKAEYPDGRDTNLTGREAYRIYIEGVSELLPKFGGGGMFSSDINGLVIGEIEELWDVIAIAMFPSKKALIELNLSEEMQELGLHRKAGLAGQLHIETSNAEGIWPELTKGSAI